MALHPLFDAVRRTNLADPSSADFDTLFDSVRSDGVTPAERQLMGQIRDALEDRWSPSQLRAFDRRLAAAPRGPIGTPTNARGPDPEGLGSRMRTVWMQGVDDAPQLSYVADMARLGADLGFNLVLQVPFWTSVGALARDLVTRTGLPVEDLDQVVDVVQTEAVASVWGEDNKILSSGAGDRLTVLVPPDISEVSLTRAQAYTATEGYHPFAFGFQGAVDQRREGDVAEEKGARLGRDVKRTATFIEGGNLLPAVTPDGEPYALVGRDTLIVSAFHLDEIGAFSAREVGRAKADLRAQGKLTRAVVEDAAAKLLAAERSVRWNAPRRVTPALRRAAEDFVAKIELTRVQLAADIDVAPERVVSVTQPEFHIDMHMRPLAPGEVLVQHPAASIRLLDELLEAPGLPRWERAELSSMRDNAYRDLRQLGGVYDQILDEMADAGLVAIPTPGVFRSYNRQANFLNAVPGTAEDGTQYFLTNASSLPSLERGFARFVERYGVDRVEFLGRDGGGPRSLNASEQSLELSGGLDCRQVDHAGRRAPRRDLERALRGFA